MDEVDEGREFEFWFFEIVSIEVLMRLLSRNLIRFFVIKDLLEFSFFEVFFD